MANSDHELTCPCDLHRQERATAAAVGTDLGVFLTQVRADLAEPVAVASPGVMSREEFARQVVARSRAKLARDMPPAGPRVKDCDCPDHKVERAVRLLLEAVDPDPDREGLAETPVRVARWWSDFINYEPGSVDTTFTAVETDQMVVVSGVPVWSLCEHHLLPFSAVVAMGYITRQKVVGLSKFARVAQAEAHKLQLQERLVRDIATQIERIAATPDVAVVAKGEHLCMTMRGIRSPGQMTTSVMWGAFRADAAVRAEFLSLAGV